MVVELINETWYSGPMGEIWLPVPGYEGHYEVSNLGRVRGPRGTLVQPHLTHDGYARLTLSGGRKNTRRLYTVHVLVASAFIGPRPDGKEVNHRDGVKTHNRDSNLEYVTPKRNHEHAAALGLHARGSRQGSAKLTEAQVREIRRRHATGESGYQLAKEYHMTPSGIWLIVRRKNWAWLSDSANPEGMEKVKT